MKVGMVNMNSVGAGLKSAMVAAVFALAVALPAHAAEKQLSSKVVKYIMDHTWDIMPGEITVEGNKPDQKKVVKVDKKKKEVKVSEKEAREIIMIARRSALAENCGLSKLREQNYKTLMLKKQRDKTKTLLDIVYINQMHLFTVALMRNKVVAADDKKEKKKDEKKSECQPGQKEAVTAEIKAFLKANPIQTAAKKAK